MRNTIVKERKKFFKPVLKRGLKQCEFEGCTTTFMGVIRGASPSKYCPEHGKPIYRKFIDKDKIKAKKKVVVNEDTSNQIIKHSYKLATVIIGKCQLNGCNKDFDILVIPNCFTYPKFCEEHRNKYKRERFNSNGKTC